MRPPAIISGVITSPQNKRVAKAVRLKKRTMRERERRFLVEGTRGVLEALRAGAVSEVFHAGRLPEALAAETAPGLAKVLPVSDAVMAHLTSTVTPQGVLAVANFVDSDIESIAAEGIVPVLCEVRDPGNAGTIVRSADAAGATGVVFTATSVDAYNPKTVRASAGSLFHLPVVRGIDAGIAVSSLRARGFAVLAAAADGDSSIHETDLAGPVALLLGNEAHGLAGATRALADRTVRVPIEGSAESLNLAAAATVILFEAARQRTGSGARLAEMVAGAAHDLRSPLTALRGFSSTLLSRWDRLNDQQRLTMIEGIEHDATRMGAILAQLVDASRLASGRLRLAIEPLDLRDVADAVALEAARWGHIDVVSERGSEPAPVLADRARLRSILLAMIDGANWWGETGPVRLEVRSGRSHQVSASKEGSTLGESEARDSLRPRPPGTGGASKVGLYVARGLAEAHGGSLDVSVEGAVRFTLTVPPSARTG